MVDFEFCRMKIEALEVFELGKYDMVQLCGANLDYEGPSKLKQDALTFSLRK